MMDEMHSVGLETKFDPVLGTITIHTHCGNCGRDTPIEDVPIAHAIIMAHAILQLADEQRIRATLDERLTATRGPESTPEAQAHYDKVKARGAELIKESRSMPKRRM